MIFIKKNKLKIVNCVSDKQNIQEGYFMAQIRVVGRPPVDFFCPNK